MAKYRSEIFKLSEEYFDKSVEHDYIAATYANNHDYNAVWNDYSYHKHDPFLKVAKSYFKKINEAEPLDYYDEIAKKIILRDINDYISNADDIYEYANWGSMFSEPQSIYEVFEVMPTETRKDILNIIKRMEKVPVALNQWVSGIKDVSRLNTINARLRTEFAIEIIKNYSEGSFTALAKSIDAEDERLIKAAKETEVAYEQVAAWLELNYIPMSTEMFGVGKERYLKNVKQQTGLDIDPLKVYQWGIDEVNRINFDIKELSKQWGEFDNLIEIRDYLNNDPKYYIDGRENFKAFLEGITKMAIKELNGTVFNIPVAMRKCDVELEDMTIDESPYYKSPSDDFSRPGKTVYPTLGRTRFTTWENYSTWFHESVPGHHMQIAYSILNKETLTRYQREYAWNSGYGEGWALYSERLMDELGYFDDPGYKMGYLMCQAMRAARLVVDIGLHLGYTDPYTGDVWNFDSAVKFMEEFALLNHTYAVSEVKRYISWSGQAITYKLGERVWLNARGDAKKRLGNKFDLKKFHVYALKLGPMGLDMLEEELSKWNGK